MSQNQPKKILVNGCSHTRALIPDNEDGPGWAERLSELLDKPVLNLAEDGKANEQLVEECIRYLVYKDDVDHIIIQLTQWQRINLFRRKCSMHWESGDLSSQILRLQEDWHFNDCQYVKLPGLTANDFQVRRHIGFPNEYSQLIGDATYTQNRIVVGTLIHALWNMCVQRDIKLTIINYSPLGDVTEDPVWNLPEECFLIRNRKYGLYNHLNWKFSVLDNFHFEEKAHDYIAKIMADNYNNQTQIEVNEKNYDRIHNVVVLDDIFDYTNGSLAD